MKKTQLTLGGQPMDDGKEQPAVEPEEVTADGEDTGPKTMQDRIVDAIREVFDPEIPVNIYELGLIYDINHDESTGDVKINMTLTSPACPAAQTLPLEVRRNVAKIEGVKDVDVEVVFDPPWSMDRMSDVAKLKLGML